MMLLVLLPTAARAAAFSHSALPLTLSFHYAWEVPEVAGTAAFTFQLGTLRETTAVCAASGACIAGRFDTDNSGSGLFSTNLVVHDCILRFADYSTEGDRVVVPTSCAVRQDLTLAYDTTSATYAGEADFGTVDFERVFDCSSDPECPLERDRDLVFRRAGGPFSGALAGPGVGVFVER